jgi:anti-sigma factor ChrR (cupin superfamily)
MDMSKRSKVLNRLAEAVIPAELNPAQREALYARIRARIIPDPPAGTYTVRAADMRWVAAGPGVEVKVLRIDRDRRDQTVLIRLRAGAVVGGHRHTQEEECLVLEGEVFIGDYRLQAGDMHVARPGAVHAPIRAPVGALLLIRSEMPPKDFRIAGG